MNYAKSYLEDIIEGYPLGTDEPIHELHDDGATVCIWIDGAWYAVSVNKCPAQDAHGPVPAMEV